VDDQKQWLAGVFDRAAPTYDRIGEPYHGYFAARLVELTDIPPGSDVIDVACGRGAVLLAAAERAGSLTGIDVSPAMVELAAGDLRAAGVDRFRLLVMDAERLAFPDARFDVLTAAFLLFFLSHPERAAAEFRRVLRPGGRVAVSTWAEEDPRWEWEDDLLASAGTPRRRAVHRPFDRVEEVTDLLAGAGFRETRVHREETEVHFSTEAEWWDWHWSFSLRGLLEQLDESRVQAIRAAAFERMAPLRTPRGYPVRLSAWIVVGRD